MVLQDSLMTFFDWVGRNSVETELKPSGSKDISAFGFLNLFSE